MDNGKFGHYMETIGMDASIPEQASRFIRREGRTRLGVCERLRWACVDVALRQPHELLSNFSLAGAGCVEGSCEVGYIYKELETPPKPKQQSH